MSFPNKNDNYFPGPKLRDEIEYLTRSSFRWVGLRSVDYSKPCYCQKTGDTPTCKRCMRTGFLFTDYLVKAYKYQDVMGVLFNAQPVTISTGRDFVILRHDRVVNKRDWILEIELDADTGKPAQPFRVVRMYEVQDVYPLIGDESRREFWKCSIEERNIDDGRPGEQGAGYTYTTNRDKTL